MAPGFLRRLKYWWHTRDPDVRYIVEVGVDEIPEEVEPVPSTMEPPLSHIGKNIDMNSKLLDDPKMIQFLLESAESKEERVARLRGLKGQVRQLITSVQGLETGPRLFVIKGRNLTAWLLTYNMVITAARIDELGRGVKYGMEAIEALDRLVGEVQVTVAKLKPYIYRWGPEFSVYIKGIDNQHRYLVTVLNNLYRNVLAGEGEEVVSEALNRLIDYTRFHFRSEEKLFDKYGYPRADSHRRQHESFVNKVTDFVKQYEAGEERVTLTILHFLSEWLKNHILVSDHDYGEWFYSKNIPVIDESRVVKTRVARRRLGLE